MELAMPAASTQPFTLGSSVGGPGAANKPADVAAVHAKLLAIREASAREGIPLHGALYIPWPRRMPMLSTLATQVVGGNGALAPPGTLHDVTLDWILQFQSLFMHRPDGMVTPGSAT